MTAAAYCLQRFPGHGSGRRTHVEPSVLPELRSGAESLGQRAGETRAMQRALEISNGHLQYSAGTDLACMWDNYLRPGKEPSKLPEGMRPDIQAGLVIVPAIISQTSKPQDSWDIK